MNADSDQTLVMIPGLNCNADLFASQIAAFEATHHIVIADNTRDDTITGMAERALRSVEGSCAVMGLSMGGYVALEMMRLAPLRVHKLALLDTTAAADSPGAKQSRENLISLAANNRFDEVHDVLWPRLVAPPRLRDASLEGRVLSMMRKTGAETFMRQQKAIMARNDAYPVLEKTHAPVFVLVGIHDQITPPEIARTMAAAAPSGRLFVIEDSGHMSTMEQPEVVNTILQQWIDS